MTNVVTTEKLQVPPITANNFKYNLNLEQNYIAM
jgi:hypothetical protein